MSEAVTLLPALPLQTQMQGLALLGLDMQRMQLRVGPLPDAPDALVPVQAYEDMWHEAQALYRQPGLPTALAQAVPFGAFGALDYLVGSADTIAGSCESALLHFAMVIRSLWLEHEELEDETHVLRVRRQTGMPAEALEFTLSSIVCRLKYVSDGRFKPLRAGLPVPRPMADDWVRHALYGDAVVYDFPCAEITIDARTWRSRTTRADPYLHATLKRMAAQLQFAQPEASPLENALRARLRAALAQGRVAPGRMASLLGVSERTLQRRLAESGRSFSAVLEDFRREECARLLCNANLPIIEIANRLGYAEQTSFTRAFRRWMGTTPSAWRAQRGTAL